MYAGTKPVLDSLKTKVHNLDEEESKNVPADLSKPCNVVNKDINGKFFIKVNVVDTKMTSTSGSVAKTQCDAGLEQKIEDVDKKIPNTTGLVRNTHCNTKIIEIENKISSVTGLFTTAAFNTKAFSQRVRKYLIVLVWLKRLL